MTCKQQLASRENALSPEGAHDPQPLRFRFLHAWAPIPTGERTNTWTHGIGAAVFLLGGAYLIAASAASAAFSVTAAVSVFVISLLALYGASTAYHASTDPIRKALLRKLDHCCIYLLIAGTYTPFATMLGGGWGGFLLLTIWTIATIGITLKLRGTVRNRWISTALYLGMGWLVVVAAAPMLAHFGRQTMAWLLAGGIAYTAGTPFYQLSRLPHSHAIWHGFVMLGSGCHFIAVASALATGVVPA